MLLFVIITESVLLKPTVIVPKSSLSGEILIYPSLPAPTICKFFVAALNTFN